MKKIEMMKKGTVRLAIALLLLAVLGSVLTGCSGGKTATTVVDLTSIEYNADTNSLTRENLKTVADFLGSNKTAYIQFVAAYRGYNMTEENFDLEAERPALDPSPEAAIAVLKANDKDSKALASVNYSTLNTADMLSIIDALKVNIPRDGNRGVLGTIEYWIGIALSAITNTVGFGNYLVGICIFAIIIELLLLPLGIKQQKNSIRQAKLRPKEMAIRRKFAGRNDQATQQKMQQEIQELYTRENYNPMSGCLPLLIQLPIILILYNIVVDPVRYTLGFSGEFSAALTAFYTTAKAAGGLGGQLAASTRGTIEILSAIKDADFSKLGEFLFFQNGAECYSWLEGIQDKIPSFSIGSLNFGQTPSIGTFNWLWIIPIVTFGVYFASTKLTRKFTYQPSMAADDKQMGCSNNIMDITMPLMSVYFSFIIPATISVYWIFKSILSTLKQFILSRVMPLPQFTEEDIKAAEKELKGKKNSSPSRTYSGRSDGTKPRSLHHIDDDDDLPAAPSKPTTPSEPKESKESAETPIEQSPLKDDSDKPTKND